MNPLMFRAMRRALRRPPLPPDPSPPGHGSRVALALLLLALLLAAGAIWLLALRSHPTR